MCSSDLDNTLSELLELINRQLTEKGLKVEKASAAVIDATIIQTAGSKQRQAIEVDEEGQVSGQTTPGKDSDARRTKKNGLYKLGLVSGEAMPILMASNSSSMPAVCNGLNKFNKFIFAP